MNNINSKKQGIDVIINLYDNKAIKPLHWEHMSDIPMVGDIVVDEESGKATYKVSKRTWSNQHTVLINAIRCY